MEEFLAAMDLGLDLRLYGRTIYARDNLRVKNVCLLKRRGFEDGLGEAMHRVHIHVSLA